ncbi:MAG: ankyrin repeat domain-containing protein [Bacteroidales bacterium]|nr:ankyrin repeat domain-containing protein [Bacteroidales bacterium]
MNFLKKIALAFLLLSLAVSAQGQKNDELGNKLIVAAFEDNLPEVELLLTQGANVNSQTEEGVTPLMYAAQNGNNEMVEFLITNGADVNSKPEDGFTALISACLFNNLESAVTLIENDADINAANIYGATPLMIAAAYGYNIITDMLLYYGADTEKRDLDSNTALIIAATLGYTEIVDLLLNAGSDINSKDEEGYTPLMAAALNNNISETKLLITNGALLNQVNNNNYSALQLAVRNGNDSIVKLLLNSNADPMIINVYGYNASQLALMNNNRVLFRIIQKKAKKDFHPFFNSLYLNLAEFNIGFKDLIIENAVGTGESRYNLLFFLGHGTRIGYKKILFHVEGNVYNQFNEKRSYVFGGIRKRFVLVSHFPGETGCDINLRYMYSYGHLKGTEKSFINKGFIVPGLGLYHNFNSSIGARIGYEYVDFETNKLSPHKITAGFYAHIGLRKNPKFYKSVYWIY